ncbi:DMT family transporter [uncultured Thermanaerothrix sp.]|uniref:DMT family transporter n=1 Tax=uncultured Thermanaerothrix sp. TaxID=1195149 RepID=UPI002606E48C|nr:DMT family transporter [uncultured Thermanaerothrix sp.]
MSIREWSKFILLGLIWGSSFLWIKIGVQELGPFTLVTLRVFFATLGLWVVARVHRATPPWRQVLPAFFVLGVLNMALPFVLISWSEQYISSGMAAILNSTVPLFTLLIAPLFLPDDPWTLPKGLGLVVGFLGVVVLMSNQVQGDLTRPKIGQLTMLLAAISYAAAAVYARRKVRGLPPDVQSLGQSLMAILVMFPLAFSLEAPFTLPQQPLTWIAVLWLGLMGSCVATLLYYSLLQSIGPTRTTLVTYIFPLVGVILGALFLHERPDWHLLVGGALIISGVAVVNLWRPAVHTLSKIGEKT